MHPSRTSGAPVAYSSTNDVSDTYLTVGAGYRYVARRQKELDPVVNIVLTQVCL